MNRSLMLLFPRPSHAEFRFLRKPARLDGSYRGSKLTIFFQLPKENDQFIDFCDKKTDLFMSSHEKCLLLYPVKQPYLQFFYD